MLFSISVFSLAVAAASVVANPLVPPKPLVNKRDGTFKTDLSQCPKLASRGAPTSVHDLRPDQIQVVGAIGDSITAGCFAKGRRVVNTFAEWRGVSFAGGGDPGAITIPNLFKTYSQNLEGASVGYNILPEFCFDTPGLCPIALLAWNPSVDHFNAALSGAKVGDILHEVQDYMVPQMQKEGVDKAFKYISLQIGSNDLCSACKEANPDAGPSSADSFEAGIRETLEYMRINLRNTIVNIMGVFKVSELYSLTKGQSYCKLLGLLPHVNLECSCAFVDGNVGQSNRALMDNFMNQYNDRLVKIVTEYQKADYPDFAVLWFPANVPVASYPITSLSNTDCFHPSEATHRLFAATIWNRMTAVQDERAQPVPWSDTLEFRCLEESDRFRTTELK